ncbi:hypothetical protein [Chryseobacterium daeguense]|uniref:hypothetical protein n=1 Tax=Chryseobacterium daeguense TaxID=412438 RepID=UPI0004269838|nr:hypothetical protein [Chryseobacterium daeguense]
MSLDKKVQNYFERNPFETKVYSTSDETLFSVNSKTFAVNHARTLEDKEVTTHEKSGIAVENKVPVKSETKTNADAGKKSPAEMKAIKDKAKADYIALFQKEPDSKLSAEKIQALIDAENERLEKQHLEKNQNPVSGNE